MSKIIVYSTDTCPWCDKAKDFLKQNKIKFEAVDVGKNRAKAKEMIEKSGQMGVPVIDVDGAIVVGFDVEKLKRLLKMR